jgi:hypothetical protein
MRRKEREITDSGEIESIIHKASLCRLAMADGERPYVVPLSFGYRDNTLYFHSAREGKKLDILRKNDKVCFEIDVDQELVSGESPCKWSMKYRSVIGFGRASLVDDPESKEKALDVIMEHYGAERPFEYHEKGFEKAIIIKVDIKSMTGKKAV